MAERLKDDVDRKLESMFSSTPVADDGFSLSVMQRMRRQIWVRRLTLPIAVFLGVIIAVKPLLQVVAALPEVLTFLTRNILSVEGLPAGSLPQMSTILVGAMLLGAVLMIGRMLED